MPFQCKNLLQSLSRFGNCVLPPSLDSFQDLRSVVNILCKNRNTCLYVYQYLNLGALAELVFSYKRSAPNKYGDVYRT